MKEECVYCQSQNAVKHGKSRAGYPRFRCRDCGKTWIFNDEKTERPEINALIEDYLDGATLRSLTSSIKTSPMRINQKIRQTLSTTMEWENFVDSVSANHQPSIVYLMGRTFACSAPGSNDNNMFIAMAVDGMSSFVLGYEVAGKDKFEVWDNLLSRLSKRSNVNQFIGNGNLHLEKAITQNFPMAEIKINFHKLYREKEINCCLTKLPVKQKLLLDTIRYYQILQNQQLDQILRSDYNSSFQTFLSEHYEEFINYVDHRCNSKNNAKIEDLIDDFRARFERFHSIKDDPRPIVNGWIASKMLNSMNTGFSRLSLYLQRPVEYSFKDFLEQKKPKSIKFRRESMDLRRFVIEVGTRVLQLPLTSKRCELKIENCEIPQNHFIAI